MQQRVDYNSISEVYNARYDVSPLSGILNYLEILVMKKEPLKILEAGCGTAHWLKKLSSFRSSLFGADYSIGMLKKSAPDSKNRINLLNADACLLPLKANSFDLIFCINAIHHFPDKNKFIETASGLLKKEGIITIIGLDPRDKDNDWYLYRYFNRTYQIDLERFPSFDSISGMLSRHNLKVIDKKLVHQVNDSKAGREVLNDHFLNKRGASQLALLTDQEYKLGIEKIINDIESADQQNKKIQFNVRLNFYAVTAEKD